MKRLARIGLYVLGAVFFLSALVQFLVAILAFGRRVGEFGDVFFVVGLFSPGVVCFFLASLLRERKRVPAVSGERQRRVVSLTPRAAEFSASEIANRNYPTDTVLRIVLSDDPKSPYAVKYDVPSDTDEDWIDASGDVAVVVEKALAERLQGLAIDAHENRYVFERHETVR